MQSKSVVTTPNASRYLQQLCKHWGHRFAVTFDPLDGHIDFGDNRHVHLHAADDMLTVTIQHADGSDNDMTKLEHVVADHLERFAFKETLVFEWSRITS